ncbi:MAG: SGNH/GDSL hydrolase family protein [Muribaculaceae bacterium]|nr:SGNH/GDSL hydrolase family protein [Muribaculaceae bacterium]
MKFNHLFSILAVATLTTGFTAWAEETEQPWKLVNATDLRIINKAFDDTERTFSRLPADIKDSIPEGRDLWDRQQCSTGIGVRFATNSSRIGVKYELLWDTHLIHMADTGLKGTDLYIFEGDSVWRHVNTNRPYVKKDADGNKTKLVESTYVSNLDGDMHEYMIYLPLYDGIEELFVMVDSSAVITPGNLDIIDKNRRIVAYGTSILQGGCASRTGMAATNIISRELNAEVMNLGFSGEGKMDNFMAYAMARIPDVDVYLIDPVPNCTEMMCDTLTYDFINILRTLRPEVPIVMLEGPLYPYYRYDSMFNKYLPAKNAAYHRNYERLIAENPANLYYVTAEGLDGPEDDGTVDGIHLTDLGFRHYADKLVPVLRPFVEKHSH